MLLPMIARAAERGLREQATLVRWSAGVQELREAMEQDPDLGPEHLPRFLDGMGPDDTDDALSDLVAEHLRHTWCTGRPILLEAYAAALRPRYPSWTATADLIEDEFIVRHTLPAGDMPHLAEYARRFPGRPDVLGLLERRTLGDGRYVKLRKLGRGAAGVVWEACDRKLALTVAIKEPHEPLTAEEAVRFAQEAETASRLDHPGIVGVHEIVRHGARAPWFVMERVYGTSLAEQVRDLHRPGTARTRRETRALRRRLLHAVAGLARAMAHAHARGVVHRDLKPGNTMVRNDGQAVILDWGAATAPDAPSTAESAAVLVVGTPESMAPEQARGSADERSDVFGLGSILYEVLTGCSIRAWPDGERPASWRRIVSEARIVAPRRRRRRAGVPRNLDRICSRALAHDPADRYPSAAALADALIDGLGGWRRRIPLLGALPGRAGVTRHQHAGSGVEMGSGPG